MDLLDMHTGCSLRNLTNGNVSDASRMCSLEQKKVASELNSICAHAPRSSELPIKLLIAEEMSKEINTGSGQPNLVAKLMGLDAIPRVEPDSSGQGISSRTHQSCSQNGLVNRADQQVLKDVYETGRQSWSSPCRRGREEDPRMALVRQKFSEAKHLCTDGNRHSRQFQDALEVLTSNKDLFLKCLQERTSLASENLDGLHSVPPPDNRRITVLLPATALSNHNHPVAIGKDGAHMKKGAVFGQKCSEIIHPEPSSCSTCLEHCANAAPPTRIVVLKPGPVKPSGDKLHSSPQLQQTRQLFEKMFFENMESAQNHEPREDAKAARENMVPHLGHLCREEKLTPSGPCGEYRGDDTSFFPDVHTRYSDNMSPLPRHSWDYANRIGSPFSSPSYSQISYSPDYSVCQEAKKRLSERWATLTYDGTHNERMLSRRSSKSLGEMLAVSEARRSPAPNLDDEKGTCPEVKHSKPRLFHQIKMEGHSDPSSRNLIRSKPLPVSSAEFHTRVDLGMEEGKTRTGKVSFKGMLSRLFSSGSRASGLEKAFIKYDNLSFSNDLGNKTLAPSSKPLNKAVQRSSNQLFPARIGNLAMLPPMYGGRADNQKQPGPVWDPQFVDECMARARPQYLKPNQRGARLFPSSCEPNLIGKSPAIGTVPRTISSDDMYADTATSHPATHHISTQDSNIGPDWMMLAKTLLSVSGLQDVALPTYGIESWHSSESPLDPSLGEKYVHLNDKEMPYEANRRQNRSTRKLVYDSVNAALMQITRTQFSYIGDKVASAKSPLGDNVLALISSWFSSEARWVSGDGENDDDDDGGAGMEMAVKDEVVGSWWMDQLKMEINDVKKEIAGSLVEALMQEIAVELAGGISNRYAFAC